MKIVQITPYFLPHIGGIERYVYNLSKYMIARGHSVDIITSAIPESLSEEVIDDIRVFRYPCLGEPLGNPIITGIFSLQKQLSQYDVIHIHGIYTYLAFRTVMNIDVSIHQRVILTHHGRVVYPKSIKNLFPKIYENTIIRYILNRVGRVVVLSDSDKIQIKSLGMDQNHISIIPNGIDTNLFRRSEPEEINAFLEKYDLHDKKIILYLAVVSKRKGIYDLINSLSGVSIDNAHLLVVGSGPDMDKAQFLAEKIGLSKRITFSGKLSFKELLASYSVASVYVLPSYFEGMPTTIIEALVMGVPVIATRIPGVKDNFSDYATLVEPGNPDELARAIEHVLNNGDTRCKLGASEIAMFDSKYVFEKYATIYQR